mmetsp:Transcript_40468/g.88446  ORF Transcript_40468/g.88446 Transcript_40468/m.88446 type:complete len:581 (-) Transcript_40468:169-1911(-)
MKARAVLLLALRWSVATGLPHRTGMDTWPPPSLLDADASASLPAAHYLRQAQDHFDPANNNSWLQAYFVNDTFWEPGSDAPIFLCVGGEGPVLDGSAVVGSVHCNIAVEWLLEKRALMFALEHRYYGCHNMSACPVTSFDSSKASAGLRLRGSTEEPLRFLSSRQAVEDVAVFVRAMNAEHALTKRNKWITWGGSYPGMLAGWSRLKHPKLIHASVASSAPVHAKLEMVEYFDHVAKAYEVSDNDVGGSPACRKAIRDGHLWIETLFNDTDGGGDIDVVEAFFGLPIGSLHELSARVDFAASGVADFPSQENDPLCSEPACNIKKICAIMTDEDLGQPRDRLKHLRQVQGRSQTRPHSELPDFWFYQTCNEFGFYQTCNVGSECMFVRGLMDLKLLSGPCEQYGISLQDISRNIELTNAHYGGLLPTGPTGDLGTCVLWPNGEVDPWSTLSVLKPPSDEQPALYVPGASHHAWTWPSRPGDQGSVVLARHRIRQQVESFLEQDCGQAPDPPVPPDVLQPPSTGLIVLAVVLGAAAIGAISLLVCRRWGGRPLRAERRDAARALAAADTVTSVSLSQQPTG